MVKHPWNLLWIVGIVFLIFSPAVHHPFIHWDDDVHCYDNPSVRKLDVGHLQTIFTTDVNKTYIPLTIFSFALEHHFVKDQPLLYHLDNILLHLGVVILIYCLALRIGLSPAAAGFGALLFGIHPMHVESVAWVTQRKDVLYSVFYLLCCWYYVGFLRSQRKMEYILALGFGALSILAKPMALSLPVILCLLGWFVKDGKLSRRFWVDKVPFALIIFPIAWATYQMNMRTVDLNPAQAPLIWLWSLSFYLVKFIVPVDLLALYRLPMPVTLGNPAFITAVLVVVGAGVFLFLLRRRKMAVFAFCYFFFSIFFLLRFDNKQDLSFVADRFMYLPSLGFCLWWGDWIAGVLQRSPTRLRRAVLAAVAAIYLVLAVLTFQQTKLWGDEFRLWSRVVQHNASAAAYNHLGNYFLSQNDYAQALTYYDKVIALDPHYYKPYGNRGVIHLREGDFDAAIADFTIVITLHPDDASAFNNRGYAYFQLHDLDAALMDFHRAIAKDPMIFKAYMNRATVYKDRGEFRLALQDLLAAQNIDPDDQSVRSNILWLKKRMGR